MKPRQSRTAAYPPRPPRERGTGRAFLLAALMHVLLALFLYHGVHWQNSTPAGAKPSCGRRCLTRRRRNRRRRRP